MNNEAVSKFLRALRDDLLDRRLLPLVALAAAGLIAALAFVVTGGSAAPAAPPEAAVAPVTKPGLPVSEATGSSTQAVAETVNGSADQRQGSSRDPFESLPGAAKESLTSSVPAGGTSSPSGSGSSSASSSPSSGASPTKTAPSTPSAPAQPKKEKVVIHYTTAAEFGVVPPTPEGATPVAPTLKPYPALKLNEPLPAENPQLVYLGVVLRTGKAAVFALTGEAILHGAGKCLPSTTHCQAVELTPGQVEMLETFGSTGQPVTYELKLVQIKKSVTTASGAAVSGAGSQLLQNNGLLPIDGMHFSAQAGVLAPAHG